MTPAITIVEDVLDREDWNAFTERSPFGHFFQSWDWGELQRGLGGEPRRLAAISDAGVVGCVQMLVFESGARKFAVVPRGPVADPADDALSSALLEAAIAVGDREGTFLLRVEPQWDSTPEVGARLQARGLAPAKQAIMPARTILVDLEPSPEQIWMRFHSNTRNRVRLAQKLGVEVRVGSDDDVAPFARLFEETTSRHGLRLGHPEQFFLAAKLFGERGAARLYLAHGNGADLAGIMVFVWGATATYLWGASSAADSARKLNPNQLLHWTAMQWARERGCTTYDLFGIPDYDEAVLEAEYSRQSGGWWNLYRFKRGFGGRVHRHAGTFDYKFAGR